MPARKGRGLTGYSCLKLHNIGSDKCEVVIYGLSLNYSLIFSQAATKLIPILSLSPSYVTKSTFREWPTPIPNQFSTADLRSPRKPETAIFKNLINTHAFSIISTKPVLD